MRTMSSPVSTNARAIELCAGIVVVEPLRMPDPAVVLDFLVGERVEHPVKVGVQHRPVHWLSLRHALRPPDRSDGPRVPMRWYVRSLAYREMSWNLGNCPQCRAVRVAMCAGVSRVPYVW